MSKWVYFVCAFIPVFHGQAYMYLVATNFSHSSTTVTYYTCTMHICEGICEKGLSGAERIKQTWLISSLQALECTLN